jgi:hypothetical protein
MHILIRPFSEYAHSAGIYVIQTTNIVLFSTGVDRLWGPTRPPIQRAPKSHLPVTKQRGLENDQLTSIYCGVLRISAAIPQLPHTP